MTNIGIPKEKSAEIRSLENLKATFNYKYKGKEIKDYVRWYLTNTDKDYLVEFWQLYSIVALRDLSEVGWDLKKVVNHAKQKAMR